MQTSPDTIDALFDCPACKGDGCRTCFGSGNEGTHGAAPCATCNGRRYGSMGHGIGWGPCLACSHPMQGIITKLSQRTAFDGALVIYDRPTDPVWPDERQIATSFHTG